MIHNFDELKQRLAVQTGKSKVAVAAAHDLHTLEALQQAVKDELIVPVLIGRKNEILELLAKLQFHLPQETIIDAQDDQNCAEIAVQMASRGEVSCIMKGKLETATLMRAVVNRETGIRSANTLSLTGFYDSPYYHKVFAITDPAVLTNPSYEQKIDQITNSVLALHALGVQKPKVAILAAAETVNPKIPASVEAEKLKQETYPACIIDGPISLDLAMKPEAAQIKKYQSPVAGDADLLVAPELISANLLAKAITELGGAETGGVVLGAKVPILLVSRAASAQSKYMSIVLAALIGAQGSKGA